MFKTDFNHTEHRRLIAGTEMTVNCEHYNSRLQSIIEGTEGINGTALFKEAAERASSNALTRLFGELTPEKKKLDIIAQYYSDVGLGKLDFSKIRSDVVEQPSSCFVKGWQTNFSGVDRKTCTYTEGFLQGAYHVVYGEAVEVTETACMHSGAERCVFRISHGRSTPIKPIRIKDNDTFRGTRKMAPLGHAHVTSETVNDEMISAGILEALPLIGDDEKGLCPTFIQHDGSPAAHLSSIPCEFYALLFANYKELLTQQSRQDEARIRLIGGSEACSFFTWGKTLTSHEWAGMILPMIQNEEDKMYALIALSNMLGRGRWVVADFKAGERIELESYNNFEAEAYERLDCDPSGCSCTVMNGTATAFMNLIYPAHKLNKEGIGDFKTSESSCVARGDDRCRFVSERRQLTRAELDAQAGPSGMSCSIV